MDNVIFISVIILTSIVFCSLFVLTVNFIYRRRIEKMLDDIDNVFDCVLTGKTLDANDTTKEDRISKLTHKAKRVSKMISTEASQAKEEKETIQSFISDMSHQMKTPLSGISMYSDLLLSENLDEKEKEEFLIRIKSGSDKLSWVMDSLIKMSRLEIGAIQLSPKPLFIKQTISEALENVLATAVKKNTAIYVAEFTDIELLHDKRWTIEAISNILENAVKYSPFGSKIDISVEAMPIYTKVLITNYETSIPQSDFNLIFKRFYRGENAKKSDGAGLGLYLTQIIMEKQGGYVMVDSIRDKSVTFSLFLQNCKK